MKQVAVLVLLTGALPAAAEEQLFVQASRINLRAEASATAAVVSPFVCGATCEVLAKSADGWVQFRIGASTG